MSIYCFPQVPHPCTWTCWPLTRAQHKSASFENLKGNLKDFSRILKEVPSRTLKEALLPPLRI
jgi:hypothetical protein